MQVFNCVTVRPADVKAEGMAGWSAAPPSVLKDLGCRSYTCRWLGPANADTHLLTSREIDFAGS